MAANAAIHARLPPPDLHIVNLITQLGSPMVMTILAIVGALVLWRSERRTLLIGWTAAFVGEAP